MSDEIQGFESEAQAIEDKQATEITSLIEPMSASLLDRNSMNHLFKIATFYAKSMIVPQIYQKSPENCFVACEMAARMNVSPIMVMQNLYIVQGKPAWSGQACVSMINNCERFTGALEFVYVGEPGTPSYGCFARISRKDGSLVKGSLITLQMANDEGWSTKNGSKWKTMPEQMLAYRAASFFARLYCPETLMGLQTTDEIRDVCGDDEPKKAKTTLSTEGVI